MSLIVMCCCCPSKGDELITPVYIPPTRPPWKQQPPPSNEYDDEDGEKYNQRLCSGKDGHRNCDFNSGNNGKPKPTRSHAIVRHTLRPKCLLSASMYYVVGIRVRYLARQFEKYHA